MPPKKKARYSKGKLVSPGKLTRTTRALEQVQNQGVSIRKAARENGLSKDFLRRRVDGLGLTKRSGPDPIFNQQEEEAMAKWLAEMCRRGMGLTPGEFLNFVEHVIEKDKRKTPFTGNRPGRTWYYNFMARNVNIVERRKESSLEASRSKVTPEALDRWFEHFTAFVSDLNMMDKPERIFNADETGFTMGSKAGSVLGPSRILHSEPVPHLSGGSTKSRLTVMFCGNADGTIIPPFMVYPDPKPKAYDPLVGAITGSVVHFTKKGWMDNPTFLKFLEHFDKHAGDQRPVILLVDSCSSHVSMEVFNYSKEKGIQLYRVVPNATHLMQPFDKGVFGSLKQAWYKVVRQNTKDHPGTPINKQTFARHLKVAYMAFYKPATVASSFRASGIYPVNRAAISNELLKPSLTFSGEKVSCDADPSPPTPLPEKQAAEAALDVYESVLSTPVRTTYKRRLEEGYDLKVSPGYEVYKKLKSKTSSRHGQRNTIHKPPIHSGTADKTPTNFKHAAPEASTSGLNVLAEAVESLATPLPQISSTISEPDTIPNISPILAESLAMPKSTKQQPKRNLFLHQLPDCYTSDEAMRTSALRELDTLRKVAKQEQAAKLKFLKSVASSTAKPVRTKKKAAATCSRLVTARNTAETRSDPHGPDVKCVICSVWFAQDPEEGEWVQCDKCDGWLHVNCIAADHIFNAEALLPNSKVEFVCQLCV